MGNNSSKSVFLSEKLVSLPFTFLSLSVIDSGYINPLQKEELITPCRVVPK